MNLLIYISNYTQLGLPYCIHISEILLNRGLALINLGQVERGMADLTEAALDTSEERREVIGIALRLKGRGCDPLAVPVSACLNPLISGWTPLPAVPRQAQEPRAKKLYGKSSESGVQGLWSRTSREERDGRDRAP